MKKHRLNVRKAAGLNVARKWKSAAFGKGEGEGKEYSGIYDGDGHLTH